MRVSSTFRSSEVRPSVMARATTVESSSWARELPSDEEREGTGENVGFCWPPFFDELLLSCVSRDAIESEGGESQRRLPYSGVSIRRKASSLLFFSLLPIRVTRTYQLSLRDLQSSLRLTLPQQFPCRAEKSEMSSHHCAFVEKRKTHTNTPWP